MQTDRWFIQNIQYTRQAGSDLTGKPDTLRLSPRKRRCPPIERQIPEPNVLKETQSVANLFEHLGSDQLLRRGQLQARKELDSFVDRHR